MLRLFLLVLALIWPLAAQAHPHAWISVKSIIYLNDKGEATAIREHWLFDKMYSAYAVEDYNPNKNGKFEEKDLLPLAKENVKNLKAYKYFTVFEDGDGKKIDLNEAKDIASAYEAPHPPTKDSIETYVTPKDQPVDNKTLANVKQIAMDFTLPLAKPIDLSNHKAVYRIYDPTYYTDIGNYEHKPVTFISEKDGKERSDCHANVELPNVDQKMVFKATALDWNKGDSYDYGYYFSEKVTITCQPAK